MNPSWTRALPPPLRDRIDASPTLQRIVPNVGWLVADRLFRMALSLLVSVWVARYLGVVAFGQLSFAIAFVTLFTPLAALGFERIVVRELVSRPDQAREILGTAFRLRLAGGLVAALLAAVAIRWIRPGDVLMAALVTPIALATVVQSLEVVDLWFQSRVRSRDTAIAAGAAVTAAAGVRVGLVLRHAPVVAFAWAWLVEAGLTGIAYLAVIRARGGVSGAWAWSTERARVLLRDSWPIMLSSFMILIYMRIDQVMLGQMAGPGELGLYSAAVRLVEAWYFIPTAVVASVFPSIVEARAVDETLFHARMRKLYRTMALAGYAIAIPTTLLSGWVVATLYGPSFQRAAPMLAVLIWSLPFTNLGVARGAYLTSMNWTRAYLLTVAAGAVVNVLLNLVLIPRWGGMGAVAASCIAYAFATYASCFLLPSLVSTGRAMTRALFSFRG